MSGERIGRDVRRHRVSFCRDRELYRIMKNYKTKFGLETTYAVLFHDDLRL